eukprot:CAMPEP_0196779320 /NCGR_PEP_ID=MMETSP1104-20130614/6319_1 /TAXON_ID=33652 /ORGANISM="Cafeteria sp., Strain Caron Lab Isolate" /LENGTH=65 /DNA_ID=CAMNT_0042149499 /DNA_START=8 /DNA_END=201 /DNA_ORIENTATION=+
MKPTEDTAACGSRRTAVMPQSRTMLLRLRKRSLQLTRWPAAPPTSLPSRQAAQSQQAQRRDLAAR